MYLFNADTGKTILSQNADQQKYVASLTKMMTALLLLESGKDLNGEVTVPTDLTQEFKDIQNANGTTMGLRIGETVRRIDLLNALLITSANDAASVIAWDVGGQRGGLCAADERPVRTTQAALYSSRKGRKAIPGKHIHVAVKAKVGQALGQPCGVGGKIHLCPLQCQRGAVGQAGGVKVALRLGKIDADAAQNAPPLLLVAVAHASRTGCPRSFCRSAEGRWAT